MTDETRLKAHELRTHAKSLDDCIHVIELAQGASQHVKLGSDAYGLLCSWLPPILAGRHAEMDSLLAYAKKNLHGHAKNLRDAADDFVGHDHHNAKGVASATADLPE